MPNPPGCPGCRADANRDPRLFKRQGDTPVTVLAPSPTQRKGRGAVGNPTGRYETYAREPFDDGWGTNADVSGAEFAPPPLHTTVSVDTARTIIARNQSPDIPFDRSINPYRGCEHGCVYCFARPTHAWLGLSPGLDFETRLFMKPDAADLLTKELARTSYQTRPIAPIALGTNTDPYQPIERTRCITRRILKVLAAFEHPVTIVTKSALVARDFDILAPMAEKRLVKVAVSITTLDRGLARRMEPRAAAPAKRLATIRALADAGIPAGIMAAPIIPGLTDAELEPILEAARDAGAGEAAYILLRLPLEMKDLFAKWLEAHAPLRAEKVMAQIRAARGGKLNDPNFHSRMTGSGALARLIHRRYVVSTRRLRLSRKSAALDCSRFAVPPAMAAAEGEQLTLF